MIAAVVRTALCRGEPRRSERAHTCIRPATDRTGPAALEQPRYALAPAGFFGDPATPHTVTGSPSGTNELTVEVLDSITGQFRRVASTDQFTVLGKRSGFDAVASVEPGRFGTPQFVTLAATDPATVFFTTDGEEPTPASTPFTTPILIKRGPARALLHPRPAAHRRTDRWKQPVPDIVS